MSGEREDVRAAAVALRSATVSRTPIPPVRDVLDPADLETGYAVQRLLTADRLAQGRRVIGAKIGLTSAAVQLQLAVDTPDYGVLFDDMLCPPGQQIDLEGLLQPRIEAEVAFRLGADLDGDTSPSTVRAAVQDTMPALEIVDSRIAGWDITLVDTVADNASGGLFVLGPSHGPLGALDLRPLRMQLRDRTGTVVSTGTGADCLGDPVLALAWLAGTMRDHGTPITAGQVVLSGALGPMVAVTPGSHFTATIDVLGQVEAVFSAEPAGGNR